MEEEKNAAKKQRPPIYEISPTKISFVIASPLIIFCLVFGVFWIKFLDGIPYFYLIRDRLFPFALFGACCSIFVIILSILEMFAFANASNFHHPELLSSGELKQLTSLFWQVNRRYYTIWRNYEKYQKIYKEMKAIYDAQTNIHDVCSIKKFLGTKVTPNECDEKLFENAAQKNSEKLDRFVILWNTFMDEYYAEFYPITGSTRFNPKIVSIRDGKISAVVGESQVEEKTVNETEASDKSAEIQRENTKIKIDNIENGIIDDAVMVTNLEAKNYKIMKSIEELKNHILKMRLKNASIQASLESKIVA